MLKHLTCLIALALATPASAQTFTVNLGGKVLGDVRFDTKGDRVTLRSTLNSTPMGVFNGTFTGTSTGTATSSRFVGESRSSRKERVADVEIAKGRALRTRITPDAELTPLSDPARAPAGLMDPVRIFGALLGSEDCPVGMRMYDGRRVVTLSPTGKDRDGDVVICTMSYRVTAGPGHLSPLGISSAKMTLRYATNGTRQMLQQLQIASGIFRVRLDRRN